MCPMGMANSKELYEPYSAQVRRTAEKPQGEGTLPFEEPEPEAEPCRLNTTARNILMTVFYAARVARFDLYRPVAHLARFLTKFKL